MRVSVFKSGSDSNRKGQIGTCQARDKAARPSSWRFLTEASLSVTEHDSDDAVSPDGVLLPDDEDIEQAAAPRRTKQKHTKKHYRRPRQILSQRHNANHTDGTVHGNHSVRRPKLSVSHHVGLSNQQHHHPTQESHDRQAWRQSNSNTHCDLI